MNDSSLKTRNVRSVFGLCVVAYLATILGVILVGWLWAPPSSLAYWAKVAWACFLATLFWGSIGSYLVGTLVRPGRLAGLGGVMPSQVIVVLSYVALSFVSMMVLSPWSSRLHLTIQVLLFVLGVALLLMMGVAAVHSRVGDKDGD